MPLRSWSPSLAADNQGTLRRTYKLPGEKSCFKTLPSFCRISTVNTFIIGTGKRGHYERGLFAGGISRISEISKFSRISRNWSDSPLFSRVWGFSKISRISEFSRISRRWTFLKRPLTPLSEPDLNFTKKTPVSKLPRGAIYKPPSLQLINNPLSRYTSSFLHCLFRLSLTKGKAKGPNSENVSKIWKVLRVSAMILPFVLLPLYVHSQYLNCETKTSLNQYLTNL